MNDETATEAIRQFFGGYFHEDWDLEADDWQGAVDNYTVGESSTQLLTLAQQLDDLRNGHSEDALKIFMYRQAFCAHNPRPLTYQEWLGQITNRLRQHAAGTERDGPN
ncbi:hypothetical protein BH09ACT7_BH09ACT7_56350 [soil metagenome]